MTYLEAKTHLSEWIQGCGDLSSSDPFLYWFKDRPRAVLHGAFSSEDLMAIAVYMQYYETKQKASEALE